MYSFYQIHTDLIQSLSCLKGAKSLTKGSVHTEQNTLFLSMLFLYTLNAVHGGMSHGCKNKSINKFIASGSETFLDCVEISVVWQKKNKQKKPHYKQ